MNELGYCSRPLSLRPPGVAADPSAGRCGGELSISAGKVKCEQCGFTDESHPVAVAEAAARAALAATPPPTHDVPPQHYPATQGDRLIMVEKAVQILRDAGAEQYQLLIAMQDQLAALSAKLTKKANRQEA